MDKTPCCGGDNPELSSFGGQLSAVDEVGNHLAKVLLIQDQPTSNTDPQKLLDKSASLPCPGRNRNTSSDLDQPSCPAYARSLSLPSASNLVSAMKGGREKHGLSPRKLSVSWAADVYDPIPTLMSHTVNGNRGGGGGGRRQYKSKNGKKNAKRGQKGNSSRGRDGKKHSPRKAPGTSGSCYNRSMDALVTLTVPPDPEFDDLAVSSPESASTSSSSSSSTSYCGTSFFKKSLSSMHYSVAEAL